jgi:hypothetical protein
VAIGIGSGIALLGVAFWCARRERSASEDVGAANYRPVEQGTRP